MFTNQQQGKFIGFNTHPYFPNILIIHKNPTLSFNQVMFIYPHNNA
jgi:hypothetical protein